MVGKGFGKKVNWIRVAVLAALFLVLLYLCINNYLSTSGMFLPETQWLRYHLNLQTPWAQRLNNLLESFGSYVPVPGVTDFHMH